MRSKCESCGNSYDQPLEVRHMGKVHVFDCFECAIHLMAPTCAHCSCRVLGHGLQAGDKIFCCGHCARQMGHAELKDRSDAPARFEGEASASGTCGALPLPAFERPEM